MGLSWSRGHSQISESRERNCDPGVSQAEANFSSR